MHQDIKNFSQIMDISTTEKLVVKIILCLHNNPNYKVKINNKEVNQIAHFDLNEELNFCINVLSGAVEIKKLLINGNEILPLYMHVAEPPTHWIENCLQWELKIPKHFYAWYQELTGHGDIF